MKCRLAGTMRTEITGLDRTVPNPAAGNLPGAIVFYGKGAGQNG